MLMSASRDATWRLRPRECPGRANTGLKRGRKSGASHRLMVTCRRRRPDTLEPSGPQPVEHTAQQKTQQGELDLRPAFS